MPYKSIQKICPECGTQYQSRVDRNAFCSKRCRKIAHPPQGPRLRTLICKGCDEPFTSIHPYKRYCSPRCIAQGMRNARPTLEAQFWAFVDKRGDDECWEWQGYREKGYGYLTARGEKIRTHRLSYILNVGPIPRGHVIRHVVCHNPPCANFHHLAPGTDAENVQDRVRDGRTVSLRGEKAPWSKLSDADRFAIHEQYAAGGVTQKDLALKYGVSETTIARAIREQKRFALVT